MAAVTGGTLQKPITGRYEMKYQFEIRASLVGVRIYGRKHKSGRPFIKLNELPKHVQEYMEVPKTIHTYTQLKTYAEDETIIWQRNSRMIVTIDTPKTNPAAEAARRCRRRKTAIRTKEMLFKYTGCSDYQQLERRLFKGTQCGVSFWGGDDHICITGYAEGYDGEMPRHELYYPFMPKEFENAISVADQEGVEQWHESNDE